jgi:transposase
MLRPSSIGPIPDDTARVAHAAFPKGHPYLTVADKVGALFTDEHFTALFPRRGQPALAPWRLVLVCILQFAEGLSDRQVADAVRSRIDWKYLLRLELSDAGFDASVLSEFRTRLRMGKPEQLLLDTLLDWCREHQLLKRRGQQRTDSTHVLAAVRALNRLEVVLEVMRHALDSLALVAPAWLAALAPAEWTERYLRRADEARLPATQEARTDLALLVGADGHACSMRCVRLMHRPGSPKCLPSTSCAAYGCRTSTSKTSACSGGRKPMACRRPPASSARRTI